MKRILLLFSCVLMVQISIGQTYKKIHRSDGPPTFIPVHLIDSVRVTGGNMNIALKSGDAISIAQSVIDSVTYGEGSVVSPAALGNTFRGSVMGQVTDENGRGVYGVSITAGFSAEHTATDSNGVFFLDSIAVYQNLGMIRVEKTGYFQTSRSFLPLAQGRNMLRIQLSPRVQVGSFQASAGGTVNTTGLSIQFPANSVGLNGVPYNGPVEVYGTVFNPMDSNFAERMPGDLMGGKDDSLWLLQSYGMADIELQDASGNKLQLLDGQSAEMIFDIPDSMQASAPASIDFWSLDHETGYWQHENVANRVGNTYKGQATHFTPWNIDYPITWEVLHVECKDSLGRPISGGRVSIGAPSTSPGGYVYTNTEGVAEVSVPRNWSFPVHLDLFCPASNNWQREATVTQPAITGRDTIELISDLHGVFQLSGIVADCAGNLVATGYVTNNFGQISYLNEGSFVMNLCNIGQVGLRAFSVTPDTVIASQLQNVSVISDLVLPDTLKLCDTVGLVLDFSGNSYSTVRIGTQLWIAENLRTAYYANGDPITNVQNSIQWSTLTTGAWAHYDNDNQYENPYGKLYNWFAVSDPRNVCPIGWHVPSEGEWTILIDYLGGNSVAGGKMKSTGIQYWLSPNTGATNVSGFSALPAGFRIINGTFTNIGFTGFFWSSSESNVTYAWLRNLTSNNSNAYRTTSEKGTGFSVRCIKD